MKKDHLKKYRVNYSPTLKLVQEVINPFDQWDCDNIRGRYYYVNKPSCELDEIESIVVEALTKETAKAIFAIHLYWECFNIDIKGGYHPFVIDGVRNIKSIEEVTDVE